MAKTRGEYRVSRDDLVRMREARLGPEKIAAVYGCNQATVRFWLRKFGLPTRLPQIEISQEAINQAIEAQRGGQA